MLDKAICKRCMSVHGFHWGFHLDCQWDSGRIECPFPVGQQYNRKHYNIFGWPPECCVYSTEQIMSNCKTHRYCTYKDVFDKDGNPVDFEKDQEVEVSAKEAFDEANSREWKENDLEFVIFDGEVG